MLTWIKNHPIASVLILLLIAVLVWYFFFQDKIKFFAWGGRISAYQPSSGLRKQIRCTTVPGRYCPELFPLPGAVNSYDRNFHLISSTHVDPDHTRCCYSN